MKIAIALTLLAGQLANAETTTITTMEKQTPIKCERDGDKMVCSTTKITAVTTTMTAPAPKRREKEGGNV